MSILLIVVGRAPDVGGMDSVIRSIRYPRTRRYRSHVVPLIRSLWSLPAPAEAPGRARVDLALVVVFGVQAVLQVVVDGDDLAWRWLSLATLLVWLPTLFLRRTHPLVPPVVFTTASAVLAVTGAVSGTYPTDLDAGVVALVIPYSLARWARGRDAVLGLALFLIVAATALVVQQLSTGDRLGGAAVVIASAALGAAFRSRAMLQLRQLDDVRQLERERLARDLHDTVAHHLTAIAITAQAGLAVADTRPGAAGEALQRIDDEATRTLAETRQVLRMLRTEATEDDAPERPLDDLAGLATHDGQGPRVEVHLADGLELSPTVAAAVHRIAQEAVANARRHARGASAVRVDVARRDDHVELSIADDGHATTRASAGFGILGMTERAALLGGHLDAGPSPEGGWRVTAVIPSGTVAQQ